MFSGLSTPQSRPFTSLSEVGQRKLASGSTCVTGEPAVRWSGAKHAGPDPDSYRHLFLGGRSALQVLLSAEVPRQGAARVLRRAFRHGRGRLDVLPAPGRGERTELGPSAPGRPTPGGAARRGGG